MTEEELRNPGIIAAMKEEDRTAERMRREWNYPTFMFVIFLAILMVSAVFGITFAIFYTLGI